MLRLHELQRERYPGGAGADDAQITFQLRMSRNRLRVRYHLGSARRRISLSRRTRVRAQIRATKIAGSPRQNDKEAPPAGALEGRRGESPRASQSRPTSFNRVTIHGRHLHLAQNSHAVRNAIMHEKECKVGAADPGGPRLPFHSHQPEPPVGHARFPGSWCFSKRGDPRKSAGSCSANLIRSPFRAITARELSVEQANFAKCDDPG
jgi:hypothetical protein